ASDRKVRLFACFCHQPNDENRAVIEFAERYADGYASEMERQQAWEAIDIAKWAAVNSHDFKQAAHLRYRQWLVVPAKNLRSGLIGLARRVRYGVSADLIRCIFGNPFRSLSLDPSWLSWHDGLLVSMARQMYQSRDFTDLPILADALEEAGCTNPDILG